MQSIIKYKGYYIEVGEDGYNLWKAKIRAEGGSSASVETEKFRSAYAALEAAKAKIDSAQVSVR